MRTEYTQNSQFRQKGITEGRTIGAEHGHTTQGREGRGSRNEREGDIQQETESGRNNLNIDSLPDIEGTIRRTANIPTQQPARLTIQDTEQSTFQAEAMNRY